MLPSSASKRVQWGEVAPKPPGQEQLLPPPLPEKALREQKSSGSDERPHFYTARELARILRVTPSTIYRLSKCGRLPGFCIGRAIRFRTQDVEEFLHAARDGNFDDV